MRFPTLPSTYRNSISRLGINLQPSRPRWGLGLGILAGDGFLKSICRRVEKVVMGEIYLPWLAEAFHADSQGRPCTKWRCLLRGSLVEAGRRKP